MIQMAMNLRQKTIKVISNTHHIQKISEIGDRQSTGITYWKIAGVFHVFKNALNELKPIWAVSLIETEWRIYASVK